MQQVPGNANNTVLPVIESRSAASSVKKTLNDKEGAQDRLICTESIESPTNAVQAADLYGRPPVSPTKRSHYSSNLKESVR